MGKYLEPGIHVVNFTGIEFKSNPEKGSQWGVITTTDVATGAINNKLLFPFKYWASNTKKDGNIKTSEEQQKEYNDMIIHVFGAARPADDEIRKIVDSTSDFKALLQKLSICLAENGGGLFRMNYSTTKPNKNDGKIYTEWKGYSWGITERTSINPSKLKMVNSNYTPKVATPMVTTQEDSDNSLPF